MHTLTDCLAKNLDVRFGEVAREEGCQIGMLRPLAGAGRVLLVGDAAGLACPSGGITSALDTGYRCGKAVAKSLADGSDAIANYNEILADVRAHMAKSIAGIRFFATPPAKV